jgi:GntR family transcriptional regulator/MocR family aminotransferase
VRSIAPGILPAIAIDRSAAKPLYQQICDGYREAIVERRLRGGQRLPSTRTLAAELKISRIPVLSAFDQLLAEGYFESRVGSGTFVSSTLPDNALSLKRPAARPMARRPGTRSIARRPAALLCSVTPEPWLKGFGAFRMHEPALDHFPFSIWSRLVARHSRGARRAALNYGSPLGDLAFRQALAAYLGTARAVRCEAEQIMVVSGSQQALEITARVLLDPRQPAWVEEPGYGGARHALAMAGARLVPVPVDHEGMDVAAGIKMCWRARAALVTPSHQYPLGATMSASRRLQLLDWAQATGSWIIEDDYDSEYRYESQPIAALQGLDRDARVVYIGTFSKVLFPALRMGYLVIPTDLVDRFSAVRETMDICPPALNPAVLADFIVEGHFARHLRRTSLLYRERRSALVDGLRRNPGPRLQVVGAEAGMHLVALCDRRRDRSISERAAREGLWAMPLSACYLGTPLLHGLVLGYRRHQRRGDAKGGSAAAARDQHDLTRPSATLKRGAAREARQAPSEPPHSTCSSPTCARRVRLSLRRLQSREPRPQFETRASHYAGHADPRRRSRGCNRSQAVRSENGEWGVTHPAYRLLHRPRHSL